MAFALLNGAEDTEVRSKQQEMEQYYDQFVQQYDRLTEKKNRTIHYSFKATPEEDAIIQRKMKTFGITNQSAFIRAMALNGYVLKLDLPELHDAVRLMGSLSNNVNQIARRLSEHGSIFETEIDDITDRQKELRTILSSILHRLDQIQH